MTAAEGDGQVRRTRAGGVGPFHAVRRLTDVELGAVEAASDVIGRFLGPSDGPAPGPAGWPGEPVGGEPARGEPAGGEGADLGRLRGDVARALDLYAELVLRSFEGYADLVEQRLRTRSVRLVADDEAQPAALTARGPAGGHAIATVWLHNPTDGPISTTLRLTDLSAHDGRVLAAPAGSFRPGTLPATAPGGSTTAQLVIALGDAPPGVYRGHVLAAGLPEAALPVELVVTDAG